MDALIHELLDWVRTHPYWAGGLVFLISFAESLAVVGILVPGVAMMFGVGAIIATGAADFWTMCAWAAAGAILGDGLSYWVGRRYRDRLRGIWPFGKHPQMLEQGERFFHRHGRLSVIFGRFIGPVRATVPLVAGMLTMPPGAFLFANVGSALLWAPAYILPGVALGASLELASEVALRLALLLALLVGLVWATGWLAHRAFRLVQPHTQDLVLLLLRAGQRLPRLRRMAEAMADPRHPEARGLAAFAALLVLSALALTVVSALLPAPAPWAAGDALAARVVTSLRTPATDRLMAALGSWTEPTALVSLGAAVALVLELLRRRTALWHWAVGLGGVALAMALHALLPAGVQPGDLTPDVGTLIAGVTLGLVAVMTAPAIPERLRWLAYAVALVLFVLALVARLYLSAGLISTLFTGTLLSMVWLAGLGVAYRTHALGEPMGPRAAAALGGMTLGILALLAVVAPSAVPATTPTPPVAMPAADWLTAGWQQLPATRADLSRSKAHPLNVQYAGGLDALDASLHHAGWHRARHLTATDWARFLSPSLPLQRLPLLPHVHAGRHEQAAWIRDDGEDRQVLRLWPSGFRIEGVGPLWLGEVSAQVKVTRFDLLAYAVTMDAFEASAKRLATDVADLMPLTRQGRHGTVLLIAAPTPDRAAVTAAAP